MSHHPLQITAVDNKISQPSKSSDQSSRREEIQATMERLWREDPSQFDPNRDAIQRERVQKTMGIINELIPLLNDKFAVDLGCGGGELSRLIRDAGFKVEAIDVSSIALQYLKANPIENIKAIQDCLPMTRLDDDRYDLVLCTEVIGYLKPLEYRLLFAELSRLIKTHGFVVCSTALDIDSENPLENLISLAETELTIDKWSLSHHMLYIRLCRFLETPSRYIEAYQSPQKTKKDKKTTLIGNLWFKLNTAMPLIIIWKGFNLFAKPLANSLKQSPFMMNRLEAICRFLWNDSGISGVILRGKRRPLNFPVQANEAPKELKHKRQLWE